MSVDDLRDVLRVDAIGHPHHDARRGFFRFRVGGKVECLFRLRRCLDVAVAAADAEGSGVALHDPDQLIAGDVLRQDLQIVKVEIVGTRRLRLLLPECSAGRQDENESAEDDRVSHDANDNGTRVNITLRRAGSADAGFLFALHEATMRTHIERVWGWNEEWQRGHVEMRLAVTMQYLIEVDGALAGMIELDRSPEAIVVSNIQVLPKLQRRGIGSAVIRLVIEEAEGAGLPVRLQVLDVNPLARVLYERLGFRVTAHVPPHFQMQR